MRESLDVGWDDRICDLITRETLALSPNLEPKRQTIDPRQRMVDRFGRSRRAAFGIAVGWRLGSSSYAGLPTDDRFQSSCDDG